MNIKQLAKDLAHTIATHEFKRSRVTEKEMEAVILNFLVSRSLDTEMSPAQLQMKQDLLERNQRIMPVPEVARDTPPVKTALDEQVGGTHYKGMKIQHAEFCQANGLKWCESAAIKYICRHEQKNKLEDIKKAIHYLRLLAKLVYSADI